MPAVSALPQELVIDSMNRVMREQGSVALQYGSGQGVPKLREQILDVMAMEGIKASADDVVVTTGSQHALELVSKLFLDPGDVVLAEGPELCHSPSSSSVRSRPRPIMWRWTSTEMIPESLA